MAKPCSEDIAIKNIVEDFEEGESSIKEFISDARRFGMLDDVIEVRIRLTAANYIKVGCPVRSTRFRMEWEDIITGWYPTRTEAYEAFASLHPDVHRVNAAIVEGGAA